MDDSRQALYGPEEVATSEEHDSWVVPLKRREVGVEMYNLILTELKLGIG